MAEERGYMSEECGYMAEECGYMNQCFSGHYILPAHPRAAYVFCLDEETYEKFQS
jgi:hypothetical protein